MSQSDGFRRVSARFNGDDGDGSGRDAHLFLSSTDLGRYQSSAARGRVRWREWLGACPVAFSRHGENNGKLFPCWFPRRIPSFGGL